MVKELANPLIREVSVYKLRIIYRIHKDEIQIITIHHSARLLLNNPNWKELI